MNDQALFILIRSTLLTGLSSLSITAEVLQSYQPEQQGLATPPTLYIHKISDNRYGHPTKTDKWVVDTMVHTETQIIESTFQIDARSILNPANIDQLTASDLVNNAAMILQSDVAIATLKAQNVGIYRITAIRQPYLINEYDRNESSPSFDFTLVHERSVVSEAPIFETIELDIHRV